MWVISVTHIKNRFVAKFHIGKSHVYVASRLFCIKMKINHFSGDTATFDTDRYIYASLILTQLNPYPRSAAEIHYAADDLYIPFFFLRNRINLEIYAALSRYLPITFEFCAFAVRGDL